jgi:hypothetical protein
VWPGEKTTAGFDVTGLDVLENDVVIVPKLFRRLVDYLNLGDDSMAGFPAFLDQAADKFFILSTDHSTTGLDAVVEVTGNTVKMTYPIEDLVFDEKQGSGMHTAQRRPAPLAARRRRRHIER